MQKNFPSVKTITRIGDMDRERAVLLRRVLKCGGRSALADIAAEKPESFPKLDKWLKSCWTVPSRPEIKMRMADEIIGGFGVEGVGESILCSVYNAYNAAKKGILSPNMTERG